MEGLFTAATPLKYAKMLGNYIKDSDLYSSAAGQAKDMGVLGLETAVKPVNFLAEQIEALRKKLTQ